MKLLTRALARLGNDHDSISACKQIIGAFTGFMESISPKQSQLKPYYFTTLAIATREKDEAAARLKGMPVIQWLGNNQYMHSLLN